MLKCSKGHLEKVIQMIDIEYCIEDALVDKNADKKEKISDFKEITSIFKGLLRNKCMTMVR